MQVTHWWHLHELSSLSYPTPIPHQVFFWEFSTSEVPGTKGPQGTETAMVGTVDKCRCPPQNIFSGMFKSKKEFLEMSKNVETSQKSLDLNMSECCFQCWSDIETQTWVIYSCFFGNDFKASTDKYNLEMDIFW